MTESTERTPGPDPHGSPGPSPTAGPGATPGPEPRRRTKLLIGAAIVLTALVAAGISGLLVNIGQRKAEAETPYFQAVTIDDTTIDPEVWGKNFPIQYDMYKRTLAMDEGEFGGSEALPAVLDENDSRARTKTQSKIELDPRLVDMWAGYAFSVDYREARGHAYMLHDQRATQRVKVKEQPGACLNCHASTYTLMRELGGGDIDKGFAVMNKTPYNEITKKATHPVACIDCHDPRTMALRITRPAFANGIAALKASQGVKGYDVNRDATSQEMRAYVCAQCHVEYYFDGEGKTLTFPWAQGLSVDNQFAYYEREGFKDWEHKITGATMLKAQHPEFEMWSAGVHASAGVTCADCHMAYQRVGATKVSNHDVRSPLGDVNASCQTCHRTSEAELQGRVSAIQDRHARASDLAQDALADLIADLRQARQSAVAPEKIAAAQAYQRKASFYIDWVISENSKGFHAPGEALRILTEATDTARKGQLVLHGGTIGSAGTG